METRTFRVTSFTMHPRVLKLLKKTADGHNVAMSGLVNLAIARLLEDKSPRQIEMLLKREGIKRRRAVD